MPVTGTYIKKIAAAVMLVLFAFILVEKNAHGHNKFQAEQDHHTAIHSSYACLLCDFQLAADADLPESPSLLSFPIPVFSYTVLFSSQGFLAETDFQHAERGPPASHLAFL